DEGDGPDAAALCQAGALRLPTPTAPDEAHREHDDGHDSREEDQVAGTRMRHVEDVHGLSPSTRPDGSVWQLVAVTLSGGGIGGLASPPPACPPSAGTPREEIHHVHRRIHLPLVRRPYRGGRQLLRLPGS